MADPVVHITNGLPDLGTGNITTLGLTIPPAGTTTASVQGGPLAQGAVTTAAPTYTNGQVDPLSLTTTGLLRVDGSGVTQPISGTITATISGTPTVTQGSPPWTVKPDGTAWSLTATSANVNVTNASIPVTGTFWQATQPVSGTVTSNQGGAPWTVKPDGTAWAMTTTSANVNVTNTVPVTGTFWQATQPVSGTVTVTQATPANLNATVTGTVTANQGGTWTVQPGNTANTTAWLVTGTGGTFPVTGTFWQATQPVSIAATVNVSAAQSGTWTVQQGTPPWTVGGDTASGSADANNPVKIGGVARTSNPTAVTNGQRVNASFDKLGKLVAVGAIRDLKGVQKTSITTASETTVVTAGTAGVFNDVYAIVVTNKSATGVSVDFKDATAGTTRMTLYAPATDTRGFTVPVDSAMVQAVAANNWTATASGAVSSLEITMLYVSNL
jgi:hypothetical protein